MNRPLALSLKHSETRIVRVLLVDDDQDELVNIKEIGRASCRERV